MRVLSWSRYHIDAIIKEGEGGAWRFTGIYGESRSEEKEKNGTCCVSYSIIAGSRGYVVVILTRSFSIVRKREVRQEQKVVC